MDPANIWRAAIGKLYKHFDALLVYYDSLHGNSDEEPETRRPRNAIIIL